MLLGLADCQTTHYTNFSPLAVRLEPVGTGGAEHLLLVNSSGTDLHDVTVTVYIWNDHERDWSGFQWQQHDSALIQPHSPLPSELAPMPSQRLVDQLWGTVPLLHAGEVVRCHPQGNPGMEATLWHSLSWFNGTRVEILGHCAEGEFRERLLMTESREFRLVSAADSAAKQ